MLTGGRLYPGEAGRLADDVHYRCPAVALHEVWCAEVRSVWSYIADGRSLLDVEPAPSAALIEAITLVGDELRAVQERERRDAENDARRAGGA